MRLMNRSATAFAVIAFAALIACSGSGSAGQGIPDTPDGTVTYVANQLAAGNPGVVWDALPASYQQDINEITREFAGKMDPEVWAKTFAVVRKAAVVLQDKKDLFMGSQMMQMAQDNQDEIAQNWDVVTTAMSTFAGSELSDLENLKSMDWGKFLNTTGAQMMEIAKKASADTEENAYENEFVAKVKGMKTEVVESSGDTAKLKITAPEEEAEEVELTRVEGRWVPSELAEDWDENMKEARESLAEMTPEQMAQQKMQIMMGVGMAEAFVDQIAQAQTSEQLDQMLQGLMGNLMGGMMGGGAQTAPDAGE